MSSRAPALRPDGAPIIEIRSVSKSFRTGFRRRRVDAVQDIGFDVYPGEIFGFLGPNGAGKTTTIKMAMGLIRPSRGEIRIFGERHDSLAVRQRLGFLPEQPYFYDYLRPTEILDFFGRLYGVPSAVRKRRIDALLDRLGIAHAADRTLRKFSKGMLQRVGIAQALIGDPELVVLDEPLSGLDPIGRKQIRDLLVELRQEGRTVFFSSHILSDIETICDRVTIIDQGRVVRSGRLTDLLRSDTIEVELEAHAVTDTCERRLLERNARVARQGDRAAITVEGPVEPVLSILLDEKATIASVQPKRETLEGLFMKNAIRRGAAIAEESTPTTAPALPGER